MLEQLDSLLCPQPTLCLTSSFKVCPVSTALHAAAACILFPGVRMCHSLLFMPHIPSARSSWQAADVCILFLGSRMHKYLNHNVNDRPTVSLPAAASVLLLTYPG